MNRKSIKVIVMLMLALFSSMGFAKQDSPLTIPGATAVDTAKARALFDAGAAFVDARKDSDWDAGRIPGAIHLDVKKALSEASLAAEVKKDEPVVFYCNGHKCHRSSKASAKAVGWGWKKVYYYRDGFPGWQAAGNPVE